ncbi:hypothetical protein [Paenibacillus apiarius]|uniref:hypothetical protein n=1 Tax=Paenibacillus apiarius TaxID=46240 RepID=UPI003B3BE74B
MRNVNIQAMRALIARIGDQLLESYSRRQAPIDRRDMFVRFAEANLWAAHEVDYPDVQWSNSEADLDKQQSPEFEGAYWVFDPVDGGVHLHQGFAFWSMSLCLLEDGQARPPFSGWPRLLFGDSPIQPFNPHI